MQELVSEKEDLQIMINELKEELLRTKASLNDAEKGLKTIELKHCSQSALLESMKDQLKLETESKNELGKINEALIGKLTALEQEVQSITQCRDEIQKQLDQANDRVASLQLTLNETQEMAEALKT